MQTFNFIEKDSIILPKWIFIILFTLNISVCRAQPAEKFHFNHFSANHQLSQTHFGPILQDKKGYLWFGTWNGLLKYDGYSFTNFLPDPGNKNSLPDTDVDILCEDGEGNIWSSANRSPNLSKYNPNKRTFTLYRHDKKSKSSGLPGNVYCLITDKHGLLWIGTDAGLCFYEAATDKFINLSQIIYPDTLGSQSIRCMMIDHAGLMWLGTANGISIYDVANKKIKPFAPADKNYTTINKEVIAMLEDHSGNIWISVWNNGLYRYNPLNGVSEIYRHSDADPNSLGTDDVTKLHEDSRKNIWVGMWGGISIFQHQTNNFKTFRAETSNPYSLSTNQVINLFEDKTGVMWIGTNGGGLNNCYLSGKKFKVYQHYDNDYISHFPTSLYKNSKGSIFMTTFGAGVQEFNPKSGTFKTYKVILPNNKKADPNFSNGTLEASDGNFWVVSFNDGLHKLDRKTGKFATIHSTANNKDTTFHIVSNCIVEDLNRKLWIGTNNGLKYYDLDKKTFSGLESFRPDTNQLGSDVIVSLYSDSEGILWIAGTNGLTLMNTKTGQVKIFKHNENNPWSISNNYLTYFYDDEKGKVWIATKGGGLNMFDKKSDRFVAYTTKDGLPDNTVYGILPDDRGSLWLSTNKGICKFTPLSSENNKVACRNYNMSDGLPGDEHNFNSCVKGDDGTLYFAGTAGLVAFKPDELTDNPFIPPVVITGFSVLNKAVTPKDSTRILKLPADETKEIKLSYRRNIFAFSFAALSYVHPEKNQYAYMLEGLDKDWIYTDASKRFVNYTNLDPGDYTFKVKASNNDGIWNETPTTIHLIITPPFWQTLWFRILIIASIAAIVYGVYRYRLSQLTRLQNIRNRISGDLHDDIGSTLNSISIYSEVAKQDASKHAHALEMIGESSRKIIDAMSDIVWTINPENDSFEDIILRMRSLAFNLLRAKNIEFSFRADESLNNLKLSMENRRNIFLIFKETMNNLVKYAEATHVSIQLLYNDSLVKLLIYDNGRGFDVSQPSNGNGLNSMKRRAKEMNAQLSIESVIGSGTNIELLMKP